MMTMNGGCLCGAIRYTIDAAPMFTAVCHCTHCQRQAGTAFSVVAAFPTDAVTVNGSPKTYVDTADSGGKLDRRFCGDCGSPLFSVMAAMPAMTIVKAGSLDDAATLTPAVQVWCKSAQPWLGSLSALPAFAENPPAG